MLRDPPVASIFPRNRYPNDIHMTPTVHDSSCLPIQQISPRTEREDTIALGKYLAFLSDYRLLVCGIAVAVTLLGAVYALFGQRIYEANILIQIDDSATRPSSGGNNIQTEFATVFDTKTATTSEMEILRSRAVVTRAVDKTRLYIEVMPKYLPMVGERLARHSKELSEPGAFGMPGYVWGSEQIKVSVFNVPEELEGTQFTLTALNDGRYRLTHQESPIDMIGKVGETLSVNVPEGALLLHIDNMAAKPGGQFLLTRQNRLETVEGVQKKLRISENRKDSGIIEVSLEGINVLATSIILNEIGREYVRLNVDRKSEKAKKSLAFLDKQLPDLKQELETSEEKYRNFRNQHRTFDLNSEAKAMLDRTVWVQNRMTELDQKKVELLVRFEQSHPALEEIERQQRVLTRQLADLDASIQRLPELEQEVVRLNRDVKVNTDLYTTLLATAQQLRLVTSSEVGNARLLDAAERPVKPIRPKPVLVLLLSAFGGIFLGVLTAFCKKNLYGRVDDPDEVEQHLGLPVRGTIPYSDNQDRLYGLMRGNGKKFPVLPFDAPSDIAIEGLRRLRTSLQFSMHESVNNIMMVTGPTSGVGKSFVSVNFAAVLASFNKRVLLIDADLRAGNLHRYFGCSRRYGLSDAIVEPEVLDRVVRANVVHNVDFIPTGALPDRPNEMLANVNLGLLLQLCAHRYDYVLVDTAPVLPVSDALEVASHAGSILNVVRGGVSTVSEIEDAVKQLNQAGRTVTGIVFNDVKAPRFARYGYEPNYGRLRDAEDMA
jgi:tyrosine-protein kinase Etk/Wzc